MYLQKRKRLQLGVRTISLPLPIRLLGRNFTSELPYSGPHDMTKYDVTGAKSGAVTRRF